MAEPLIQSGKNTSLARIDARNRGAAPVRKMTTSQIIREAALKEGQTPQQADQRLAQLAVMIQRKICQPVQAGNTVFFLFPDGQGGADFHTETVEQPDVLVSRYKTLAVAAKKLGLNKMRTFFTDPSFLRIAEKTGIPVRVSQDVQRIGQQMTPVYRLEADI